MSQKIELPDLLTNDEANAMIQKYGLSEIRLRQLRRKGLGPSYYDLNGTVRYDRGDLLVWLELWASIMMRQRYQELGRVIDRVDRQRSRLISERGKV